MPRYEDVKVAILFGGKSAEHDVSVNSGLVVMENLAQSFPLMPVYLDRKGGWHLPEQGFGGSSSADAAHVLMEKDHPGLSTVQGLGRLIDSGTRVAFLALHGPFGEDGRLQGFLETAGVPHTGSGVVGSAIAMDKDLTKRLYRQGGLKVAESRTVTREQLKQNGAALREVIDAVGLPLFVKPVTQGSSVGTSVCLTAEDLAGAVEMGLEHGASVLIEEFLNGRELTCGVLELDNEGLQACGLPPTLIRPKAAKFFDYGAKYQPGATEEITPAPVEDWLLKKLQEVALAAHALLQLRSYSRSDFIEQNGELYILETNTLPGLTRTSLFPQAAKAAGIPLDMLLSHLVCLAAGIGSPLNSSALQGCLFCGSAVFSKG